MLLSSKRQKGKDDYTLPGGRAMNIFLSGMIVTKGKRKPPGREGEWEEWRQKQGKRMEVVPWEISVESLEKFHRGILCSHREMQQSSLCVQMFYFNMKRHSSIHGIMYTWYEHTKGATDTEAIVSDWKSQLTPRRSPVFTYATRHCPWKDEPAKVRLHYLLLPLLPPPGVTKVQSQSLFKQIFTVKLQ